MAPSASPYAIWRAEDWRAVAPPFPKRTEVCKSKVGCKTQKQKTPSVSIEMKEAGSVIQKCLLIQEDHYQMSMLF